MPDYDFISTAIAVCARCNYLWVHSSSAEHCISCGQPPSWTIGPRDSAAPSSAQHDAARTRGDMAPFPLDYVADCPQCGVGLLISPTDYGAVLLTITGDQPPWEPASGEPPSADVGSLSIPEPDAAVEGSTVGDGSSAVAPGEEAAQAAGKKRRR